MRLWQCVKCMYVCMYITDCKDQISSYLLFQTRIPRQSTCQGIQTRIFFFVFNYYFGVCFPLINLLQTILSGLVPTQKLIVD